MSKNTKTAAREYADSKWGEEIINVDLTLNEAKEYCEEDFTAGAEHERKRLLEIANFEINSNYNTASSLSNSATYTGDPGYEEDEIYFRQLAKCWEEIEKKLKGAEGEGEK